MSDTTVTLLKYVAAACLCTYIALVIVTVTFAAVQTELALSVRDTESAIGQLETTYYGQVGVLAATSPVSMDLHAPTVVSYAVQATAPSLSLR